jgi:signal transduction histidine kinase
MQLANDDPASTRLDQRELAPGLVAAIALSVSYYFGVQIGFAFTLEPEAVSLLWPPNAIVLAALLLAPTRLWAWLIAAVLPAHLLAELSVGVPLAMAASWYVSNVAEALLGAAAIRWLLGDAPRFDRVRDTSVFLLTAVLFSPVATSFLDASFVRLIGWRYDGDYWGVWRMRMFSNATAASTLVPLILIAWRGGVSSVRRATGAQLAETAALLGLLCLASLFVFHRNHPPNEVALYVYAPLPLLVWAAVRRGVGTVVVCVTTLALLAITGILRGLGPFVPAPPEIAVLSLQVFLIVAAASLMLLAAALAEMRDARAAALERKESLDLALAAAHMGAWEWDVQADRITWRFGELDGALNAPSSASVSDVLSLAHPDDREALKSAMSAASGRTETHEIECRFVFGGEVRWILSKGKVLRDQNGAPKRLIGVCIDTTHRKCRELHERSQREQLAHLSRAAMLGELSGALAHELSQPLSAVLINAQAGLQELSKMSPDMRELRSILGDIAADDTRAGEVIRRLQALFLGGQVQMESVDVGDCVRGVLALEHSDLIMRNVTSELHLAPDLPAVMADPVQLQQVLLNLIINACDAMAEKPAGERRLQIRAGIERDSWVHIEVHDSGRGVENFERIFEPFYSTKQRGIGLGLAISRTIIGTHRGRLWGTNNHDGGATFHVVLPAARVEHSA